MPLPGLVSDFVELANKTINSNSVRKACLITIWCYRIIIIMNYLPHGNSYCTYLLFFSRNSCHTVTVRMYVQCAHDGTSIFGSSMQRYTIQFVQLFVVFRFGFILLLLFIHIFSATSILTDLWPIVCFGGFMFVTLNSNKCSCSFHYEI